LLNARFTDKLAEYIVLCKAYPALVCSAIVQIVQVMSFGVITSVSGKFIFNVDPAVELLFRQASKKQVPIRSIAEFFGCCRSKRSLTFSSWFMPFVPGSDFYFQFLPSAERNQLPSGMFERDMLLVSIILYTFCSFPTAVPADYFPPKGCRPFPRTVFSMITRSCRHF
jgi:hypothetical protein